MNTISKFVSVILLMLAAVIVNTTSAAAQEDQNQNQTIYLSKVYSLEQERYLPAISTIYEQCESIKIRNVVGEVAVDRQGQQNDQVIDYAGLHGHINYTRFRGVPTSDLDAHTLNSRYWIGTDTQPGDGCVHTTVSPIPGVTFEDVDNTSANGGWECNIIGKGVYGDFVLKVLHLKDGCEGNQEVGIGEVIGEEGPEAHIHLGLMVRGSERYYDVPYMFLTSVKYTRYTADDYIDGYSPSKKGFCEYFYYAGYCEEELDTSMMMENTLLYYEQRYPGATLENVVPTLIPPQPDQREVSNGGCQDLSRLESLDISVNRRGTLRFISSTLLETIEEAACHFDVPADTLLAIMVIERTALFEMEEEEVLQATQPYGKIEGCPEPDHVPGYGQRVAWGPMQFTKTSWEAYGSAIKDAGIREAAYEPEICNITDSLYAAAYHIQDRLEWQGVEGRDPCYSYYNTEIRSSWEEWNTEDRHHALCRYYGAPGDAFAGGPTAYLDMADDVVSKISPHVEVVEAANLGREETCHSEVQVQDSNVGTSIRVVGTDRIMVVRGTIDPSGMLTISGSECWIVGLDNEFPIHNIVESANGQRVAEVRWNQEDVGYIELNESVQLFTRRKTVLVPVVEEPTALELVPVVTEPAELEQAQAVTAPVEIELEQVPLATDDFGNSYESVETVTFFRCDRNVHETTKFDGVSASCSLTCAREFGLPNTVHVWVIEEKGDECVAIGNFPLAE